MAYRSHLSATTSLELVSRLFCVPYKTTVGCCKNIGHGRSLEETEPTLDASSSLTTRDVINIIWTGQYNSLARVFLERVRWTLEEQTWRITYYLIVERVSLYFVKEEEAISYFGVLYLPSTASFNRCQVANTIFYRKG